MKGAQVIVSRIGTLPIASRPTRRRLAAVLLPVLAPLVVTAWTLGAVAAPADGAQEAPPAQTQPADGGQKAPPAQTQPAPAGAVELTPAPSDSAVVEPSPAPPPAPLPTDDEIQARVEDLLSKDAALSGHGSFQAKCEEGIVTLGGKADTLSILMQAERVAGDVRGVLDVIVQVALPVTRIPDSQMLLDIQRALEGPTFHGDHIAVNVDAGEVQLYGTTLTYARKLLAERAAAEVQGVVSVQNNLRVVAPPEGNDAELARRIRLLLTGGLTPVPGIFEISVKKGEAVLRGRVPLYSNRTQAERLAYSVGGIHVVDNRLKVDPTLYLPPATVEITP